MVTHDDDWSEPPEFTEADPYADLNLNLPNTAIQRGLPFQEKGFQGFVGRFKFGKDTDTHDYYFDRNERPKRKRVSTAHRCTPCQWCNFPLSQKHHFLPVHIYGENDVTVQICANCHDIYHVVDRAVHKQTKNNMMRLGVLIERFGKEDFRIKTSFRWVIYLDKLEKEKGLERAGKNGTGNA